MMESMDHSFPFSSYHFTILIICSYLLGLKLVAKSTEDRQSYNLKTFMMCYNVYQIIACVIAMKMYLDTKVAFWEIYCPESRPIGSATAYKVGAFMYWIKVSEMSETFVFLLRKNSRQVTPLHVFHHCVTVTFIYVTCAYDFESGSFLAIFINCVVHVLMYSYYLITVLFSGLNLHKIKPLKQGLTLIQIIQFLIILVQLMAHQLIGCNYPAFVKIWYTSGYMVFVCLFVDFYRRSYKISMKRNKTD